MSRFNSFFKQLRALDRDSSLVPVFFALILVALLAYVLPWLQNPGQALTLGGYDLAEWLSLHPGVRGQSPPYLASALIRLHLVLFAALITLWIPRRLWPVTMLSVLLLVIAQLPPPEFVSQSDDMNYQQQLGLAVTTLIVCGVFAFLNGRTLATLIIAAVGVIASMWGLSQAREFMQVFALPAWVGVGAPLLALIYLVMIGLIVNQIRVHNDVEA
jgi:hypothetical protein